MHKKDIFAVYIKLANAYYHLGYSGRTGAAISLANIYKEDSEDSNSQFGLIYGLYLASIGKLEKAVEIAENRDKTQDEVYNLQYLILSAELNLRRSYFCSALKLAEKVFHKSSKMYKKILASESHDLSNRNIFMLKKLLMLSAYNLGHIYERQGVPKHAEFYFKHGAEIAEQAKSKLFYSEFKLAQSRLKMKTLPDYDNQMELIDLAHQALQNVFYS
jgi:hypothetical protein